MRNTAETLNDSTKTGLGVLAQRLVMLSADAHALAMKMTTLRHVSASTLAGLEYDLNRLHASLRSAGDAFDNLKGR